MSLGLFVDCLNAFSVPGHSSAIEVRYPGPDMQLLLKYVLYCETVFAIRQNREWFYDLSCSFRTEIGFGCGFVVHVFLFLTLANVIGIFSET